MTDAQAGTPTPLTDVQAWPTGDTLAWVVHADFARSLELTVAALRKEVADWQGRYQAEANQKDDAYAKLNAAEHTAEQSSPRLSEAERLIAHAVQIMTPEQVGQWTGVSAWQEGIGSAEGRKE